METNVRLDGRCFECGGVMKSHYENTWFERLGLPRILFVELEVIRCSKCDYSETVFPKLAPLHRMLAEHIALSHNRLDHHEIRFLRKSLNYEESDLARLLDVSTDTVLSWETEGGQIMSIQQERRLRRKVLPFHKAWLSFFRPKVLNLAYYTILVKYENGKWRIQ